MDEYSHIVIAAGDAVPYFEEDLDDAVAYAEEYSGTVYTLNEARQIFESLALVLGIDFTVEGR